MMSRRPAPGTPERAEIAALQGLFRHFSGRLEAPARTVEGEVTAVIDVVFVVATVAFFVAGGAYIAACRALERNRS
jgi:hypothetical protein